MFDRLLTKLTIALCLVLLTCTGYAQQPNKPRLILQLIVDQMRGDLLSRYQDKWGKSGFNYLINHGIWYTNAFHPHARTTTCAGHATISTGTTPAFHGIIGNNWYDRKSKHSRYCLVDNNAPLLKLKRTKTILEGRSPKNMMASTLSDELMLAQIGRAYGVSYKDRGAITLAGHAGQAYWFDRTNGGFVSSRFYLQKYPQWVIQWNNQQQLDSFSPWLLSNPKSSYLFANNGVSNKNYQAYGTTFPHNFNSKNKIALYKMVSMSPYADNITASFAKRLIAAEKLGQSANATDYLGISFSANDAIGHNFGPNSLESEENLLQLDKTLASLFQYIDKKVGLENTLIILSADHGVSDNPEYLNKHHVKARQLNLSEWINKTLNPIIKQQLNIEGAIASYANHMIYLNQHLIASKRIDPVQLSNLIIEQLSSLEGIDSAYDLHAIESNLVASNFITNKIKAMLYLGRIGDIYIVPSAHTALIATKNPDKVTHGSPWNYDAYVPMLFSNANFSPKRITTKVYTTDIAATLAAIIGSRPPSASIGNVLKDVIEANSN